ncbi:glycosyltransferase, partial [Patescibacteria group bacterium]|nr:glycosyltransferase [Patescibacteria group bacterium]
MKKNIIIVIINFNGEKFLKKCLNSLVNQDFAHKEIVVIDNGSGDNSLEIIQQFKEVELIINEVNNGYSGAADQCCHMAVERKK